VSRKEGPHGGFLYGFMFREEFKNDAKLRLQKRAEIYPAVEPTFDQFEHKLNAHRFLHILGFSVEKSNKSSIIYIPDQQAILAGWSHVKSHRLEQSKKLTEKIKTLAQEKKNFVAWEEGFMVKLKQMYLRYQLSSFDYQSEVIKLIQKKWGDIWSVNTQRYYISAINKFCENHLQPIYIKRLCEPNVNPDDPAIYDGIWDNVTSSEVEFFLETQLEKLACEYNLDSDFIKKSLINF
jgi:hypothetical protein